jgi:hypothetical protein
MLEKHIMIVRETAADYHTRPAVNASLLWDIVAPEGCLAQARYNSAWLNPEHVETPEDELDHGTVIHLACLEPHLLDERITIVDAPDWRTKRAQEIRDIARFNGRIPILYERKTGICFRSIETIRQAIRDSAAGEWIFDGGESELSFLWVTRIPFGGRPKKTDQVFDCKARADRIVKGRIVDLKSAVSASPAAFQRAMIRDGHHLRASFYLDGWKRQEEAADAEWEYCFVVVGKEPPYLVSIFNLDQRALAWGQRLYRAALVQFADAKKADRWPAYTPQGIETIGLPVFAEHQLADLEAEGRL